jgi:ribose transport system substrate-binding protein
MCLRFVATALAVLFCSGCVHSLAYAAVPDKKSLRVGVLYWSMNIPGQVAMRKGLEEEAQRINMTAKRQGLPSLQLIPRVAGDGAVGVERQVAQMFEMVRQNPDVIIVQPTDNAALAGPLRAANRANIPVVAYDQYISGGSLAAYISSDNHQAGYLDGEYIAAQFPDNQTVRLVLIEYPRVSSTVERLDGFLDALRDYHQAYRILKVYEAVEPVAGRLAGKQILQDFKNKGSIDAVFSVNDGGGLSVVDVLAAAGRTEILFSSIDGDPASVENILKHRLTHIDAAQFCGPLGAEALKAAYAIATGHATPKHALVPVFPVTLGTVSHYPGWGGPIPEAFAKPWVARDPVWNGVVRQAK